MESPVTSPARLAGFVLLTMSGSSGCQSAAETEADAVRVPIVDAVVHGSDTGPAVDALTGAHDGRLVDLDAGSSLSDATEIMSFDSVAETHDLAQPGPDRSEANDAVTVPDLAEVDAAAADAGFEARIRPMATRYCTESCLCGPADENDECTGRIEGCGLEYTHDFEGCISDFIGAMARLTAACRSNNAGPCYCRWLEQCQTFAETVTCDPEADPWERLIAIPPQCLRLGGAPDGDPICPQGPVRECP